MVAAPPTIGSVLSAGFHLYAERHGKARWGDKRPSLALNLDVPITIAVAAGADHGDVSGRNLLERWRRSGFVLEASWGRLRVPGRFVTRPAYCGWRTRRYLFVKYANGVTELYDYARDPYELRNRGRAASYRDVRTRLRSRAQANCQPPPPGFTW